MKKIGIIYICTGDYVVFWDDFYRTFEKYFLPNTEVHYFIFTNRIDKFSNNLNKRVHLVHLEALPWPLPTLMKFNTILHYKNLFDDFDYLYQSNANIICSDYVYEEDFLPNTKEKLIFVQHPGFRNKKSRYAPFERRKISTAYVPYNSKNFYVFGAMNGGIKDEYLKMVETLNFNINEDLKKNIIAKWHDESHINCYYSKHQNSKLLSPSYCYPVGMKINEKPIISGVDKLSKFDVNTFKGIYNSSNIFSKIYKKMQNIFKTFILCNVMYILNSIFYFFFRKNV